GDVNGDGYGDIIVGANLYDNGQSDEGAVFVYLGSAAGPSQVANWMAESNQVSSSFGSAVASAGDVNHDGFGEVIVGAKLYDNGQADEGAAFLWKGSAAGLGANGTPVNATWMAEANQALAELGCSVASAGDQNNDTFGDVVIGAHDYSIAFNGVL